MLVSKHTRGLGNRLKSLFSVMHKDPDYKVYWPITFYCYCPWDKLFKNDIEHVGKPKKDERWGSWRLKVLPEDNLDIKHIDFLYNDTPESIRKTYVALMARLRPVTAVRDRIPEKVYRNSFSIRTWHERPTRRFNQERVIRKIAETKGSVFVSCDSPKLMRGLVNKFGNKIFFNKKRTNFGDTRTITGVQDCLVDLYTGGRAKKLYVSEHSTFSELQWWFGGCRAEVEVL